MSNSNNNSNSNEEQTLATSLRLALIATVLTTIGDAITIIASLEAIDEFYESLEADKRSQLELEKKLDELQNQIDELKNELSELKSNS